MSRGDELSVVDEDRGGLAIHLSTKARSGVEWGLISSSSPVGASVTASKPQIAVGLMDSAREPDLALSFNPAILSPEK